MLAREEVVKAVGGLFKRIYESPFGTLGRFAAWLGMSFGMLRLWEFKGAPDTVLARLMAEACRLPLSDWIGLGGERERLHEDDGSLNSIWAVGLVEDIGVNPNVTRSWAKDEMADAEERLAIILSLSRQKMWERRYWHLLMPTHKTKAPEKYRAFRASLARRRAELGYSLEDIARLAGTTKASVASWEASPSGYNWRTHQPKATMRLYEAFLGLLEPKEN